MIAPPDLRWLLTACFVAVAGWAAWRAVASRQGGAPAGDPALQGVGHGLHAVMAVAMAVMTWPWGMRAPAAPQVVFFSLAAGWFLAAPWFGRSAPMPPRRFLRAVPHALAMVVMAWMADASHGGAPRGGDGSAGKDMTTMAMQAPGGIAAVTLTGVDTRIALVLAVVFLCLAVYWLTRGFAPAGSGPAAGSPGGALAVGACDRSYHGLMALGTAVVLIMIA